MSPQCGRAAVTEQYVRHLAHAVASAGRSAPRWQDLSPSAPRIGDSCHLTCGRASGAHQGGGLCRLGACKRTTAATANTGGRAAPRRGGRLCRLRCRPDRDQSCHLALALRQRCRSAEPPEALGAAEPHAAAASAPARRPLRRGHAPDCVHEGKLPRRSPGEDRRMPRRPAPLPRAASFHPRKALAAGVMPRRMRARDLETPFRGVRLRPEGRWFSPARHRAPRARPSSPPRRDPQSASLRLADARSRVLRRRGRRQ